MDAEDKTDAPTASKPWLDAIKEGERAFQVWQEKCDSIDKKYADLSKMAGASGDREFQIFWANMEILRPSIYQRPPQPVVMPRHSDTGEIPRKAAELIERALEFDVEADDLHETLLLVRDDLALSARGAPWVLDDGRCIHVDRRDFVHEPARKWSEVGWVARRAYVSLEEGLKRFGKPFLNAKREEIGNKREDDYQSTSRKAQVWEVWSKTDRKVIWVTEGVDTVLDESEPMIDVKGFFPCPKPAYATVERGTLKPVPDMVYYKDQIDEINELTARISGLAESLRLKGFYASGVSEVGEAVEAAIARTDDRGILIPVSNFAALGGSALKDAIVWLPVTEVAQVISSCIDLRKQLIEDVYEITGLSDIMRGVTQAQETLGAQNLKAQYGSVRVQQKQAEMVRVGLAILSMKAEIMAETFDPQELLSMSGMQLPTQADVQQMAMQAQEQGQPAPNVVSAEQVFGLLRDQKMRPFAMDIETDSTIAPNEEAEKSRRVEFLGAVGQFLGQARDVVESAPETAPFMAELLRFGVGGFRAGRDLGAAIDDFTQQMEQRAEQAGQNQQPDAETIKAQSDAAFKERELGLKEQELQLKAQDMQFRAASSAQQAQTRDYDARTRAATKQFELMLKQQELGLKVDDQRLREAQAEVQALIDAQELELEREQRRPVGIGD